MLNAEEIYGKWKLIYSNRKQIREVWERRREGRTRKCHEKLWGEHLCILIIVMASWMYIDAKANQIACMVC